MTKYSGGGSLMTMQYCTYISVLLPEPGASQMLQNHNGQMCICGYTKLIPEHCHQTLYFHLRGFMLPNYITWSGIACSKPSSKKMLPASNKFWCGHELGKGRGLPNISAHITVQNPMHITYFCTYIYIANPICRQHRLRQKHLSSHDNWFLKQLSWLLYIGWILIFPARNQNVGSLWQPIMRDHHEV